MSTLFQKMREAAAAQVGAGVAPEPAAVRREPPQDTASAGAGAGASAGAARAAGSPAVCPLPAGLALPPAAVCGAMRVAAGPPESPECESAAESPLTPPAGPQAAPQAPDTPQAAPAPCGCPIFWVDAYGNLHCGECHPPRSAAMVRRKLIVANHDRGSGREWRDFETDEKIISGGSNAKTELSEQEKIISRGSLKSLDSLNFPVVYRGTCPGGGAFAAWCEKISPDEKLKSSDAKKIISSPDGAGGNSASPATPTVPAGARIFYLMHDGKQVEAGATKVGASKGRGGRGKSGGSKSSTTPAGPAGGGSSSTATIDRSKAKWFTWEGADRWWPVVAVSGAEGAAGSVSGEERAAV